MPPAPDMSRRIGRAALTGALATVVVAALGYRWNIPLAILWAVPPLGVLGLVTSGRSAAEALRRWREALTDVGAPWATTRAIVLVTGLVAVLWLGFEPGPPRFRVADNPLANLPARWDAGWYLNIARQGYTWEVGGVDQQQRVAFFPAFPLAMRYAADLLTLVARVLDAPEWLGGGNARFLWAGVLVCLLSSLCGTRYVAAIARDHGDANLGRRSAWLLFTYPFAVFFNLPYSEGMFLLAAGGALLHLHRGHAGRAAAFGLLAGLTRPNGFLLAGALAAGLIWQTHSGPRRSAALWLAVTTPLLGMAAYSVFVYALAGDPLAWMKTQAAWGNTFTVSGFAVAKWHHAQQAGLRFLVEPFGFFSLAAVVLVVASVVPVARLLGPGYATFQVLYLLPPLLINLPAIGRMTAVLFPTFIWLAAWARTPARLRWLAGAFLVAQVICAVRLFTWGPLL